LVVASPLRLLVLMGQGLGKLPVGWYKAKAVVGWSWLAPLRFVGAAHLRLLVLMGQGLGKLPVGWYKAKAVVGLVGSRRDHMLLTGAQRRNQQLERAIALD